jgi:hypothetical protein
MSYVHEMLFILKKIGDKAALKQLLRDWYAFGNSVHMTELEQPLIKSEIDYFMILKFRHYFPEGLKKKIDIIERLPRSEIERINSDSPVLQRKPWGPVSHFESQLGVLVARRRFGRRRRLMWSLVVLSRRFPRLAALVRSAAPRNYWASRLSGRAA